MSLILFNYVVVFLSPKRCTAYPNTVVSRKCSLWFMAGNLILIVIKITICRNYFQFHVLHMPFFPLVLVSCLKFWNFHEIDTHGRSIAVVMKLRSKLKIRKPATLACYRKYEHLLHLASHLLLNYVHWDQSISHPPIFKKGDNIGVTVHFRGCKLLKKHCWYNLNFEEANFYATLAKAWNL